MDEIIFLVEESGEVGYVARALGHSIFTDGDTTDEIETNMRDAISCHFKEEQLPKAIRLHYVKDLVIAV